MFLLGGAMTLQDGTTIDSRKQVSRNRTDYLLHQAMSRSEDWWRVARQLCDLLLADSGPSAWALVWAPRTVTVPKPNGSLSRPRTAKLLGNDVSDLTQVFGSAQRDIHEAAGRGKPDVYQEARAAGNLAVSKLGTPYRWLEHGLLLEDMQFSEEPPTVYVGCFHTQNSPLHLVRERWPKVKVVLPHTPTVDAMLTDSGLSAIRYSLGRGQANNGRGTNNLDLHDYYTPVESRYKSRRFWLTGADFNVTRHVEAGVECEAAIAAAAIRFVRTNYDVSVGFADLINNEALRETLLDRQPVPAVPKSPARMPKSDAVGSAADRARQAGKDAIRSEILSRLPKSWEEWKPASIYFLGLGNKARGVMGFDTKRLCASVSSSTWRTRNVPQRRKRRPNDHHHHIRSRRNS